MINILKNGIESMPNNRNLRISQTYYKDTMQINIRDEGTGMTQEQINRLGEPYFTTKEKGTGLGLMVSYSIIKAMGGSILVTSEQGKGTCFSLRLPILQESEQEGNSLLKYTRGWMNLSIFNDRFIHPLYIQISILLCFFYNPCCNLCSPSMIFST